MIEYLFDMMGRVFFNFEDLQYLQTLFIIDKDVAEIWVKVLENLEKSKDCNLTNLKLCVALACNLEKYM